MGITLTCKLVTATVINISRITNVKIVESWSNWADLEYMPPAPESKLVDIYLKMA